MSPGRPRSPLRPAPGGAGALSHAAHSRPSSVFRPDGLPRRGVRRLRIPFPRAPSPPPRCLAAELTRAWGRGAARRVAGGPSAARLPPCSSPPRQCWGPRQGSGWGQPLRAGSSGDRGRAFTQELEHGPVPAWRGLPCSLLPGGPAALLRPSAERAPPDAASEDSLGTELKMG